MTRWRERLRFAAPALSVAAAAFLMSAPVPLAWGLFPHAALLLLLCWASVQPALMPPWVGFALGLLTDLLLGAPVGTHALLFVGVIVGVRLTESRLDAHALLVDWLAAAVAVVGFQLGVWWCHAFVGRPAPLPPLLGQAATTILAYPLAVMLVARMQRRLARDL